MLPVVIRFIANVFCKLLSVYVDTVFSSDIEAMIWDPILVVPGPEVINFFHAQLN